MIASAPSLPAIADGDDDQQQGDRIGKTGIIYTSPTTQGFQPVTNCSPNSRSGRQRSGASPCHAAGDFQQPTSGDNLPYKGDQLDGGEDQDFLDPIGIP